MLDFFINLTTLVLTSPPSPSLKPLSPTQLTTPLTDLPSLARHTAAPHMNSWPPVRLNTATELHRSGTCATYVMLPFQPWCGQLCTDLAPALPCAALWGLGPVQDRSGQAGPAFPHICSYRARVVAVRMENKRCRCRVLLHSSLLTSTPLYCPSYPLFNSTAPQTSSPASSDPTSPHPYSPKTPSASRAHPAPKPYTHTPSAQATASYANSPSPSPPAPPHKNAYVCAPPPPDPSRSD